MKIISILSLGLFLVSTEAQAGATYYLMRNVCKFDMEQYCKGISIKRLRDLRECLGKHERDLLPQCQDHYKDAK
jgi:hypothetical protein